MNDYLTVSGCRHTLVAGLGDDPDKPTDGVLVTGPHGRQFDGSVTTPCVKERQLSVLHAATQDRLVLCVVFN